MSRFINPDTAWDDLTEDEQSYLNDRQMLKDQYLRLHKARTAKAEERSSEDEVVAEVSAEEWVAKAKKTEIEEELDKRGIQYDPKSSKADLGQLLLDSVSEEG